MYQTKRDPCLTGPLVCFGQTWLQIIVKFLNTSQLMVFVQDLFYFLFQFRNCSHTKLLQGTREAKN